MLWAGRTLKDTNAGRLNYFFTSPRFCDVVCEIHSFILSLNFQRNMKRDFHMHKLKFPNKLFARQHLLDYYFCDKM